MAIFDVRSITPNERNSNVPNPIHRGPDDGTFLANWNEDKLGERDAALRAGAWDDFTEHQKEFPTEAERKAGKSDSIEGRHHNLSKVLESPQRSHIFEDLNAEESKVVSDFYFLWQARAHHRDADQTPIGLVGFKPDTTVTNSPEILQALGLPPTASREDVIDEFERKGVITAHETASDGNAATSARQMHGFRIRQHMKHQNLKWGVLSWACITLNGASLVVPDAFRGFPYVPLSPTKAILPTASTAHPGRVPPLFTPLPKVIPTPDKLREMAKIRPAQLEEFLNRNSRIQADKYYFQRP